MITIYLIIVGFLLISVFITYIFYKIKKSIRQELAIETFKEIEKEDKRAKKIKDNLIVDSDVTVDDELRKYIRDKK